MRKIFCFILRFRSVPLHLAYLPRRQPSSEMSVFCRADKNLTSTLSTLPGSIVRVTFTIKHWNFTEKLAKNPEPTTTLVADIGSIWILKESEDKRSLLKRWVAKRDPGVQLSPSKKGKLYHCNWFGAHVLSKFVSLSQRSFSFLFLSPDFLLPLPSFSLVYKITCKIVFICPCKQGLLPITAAHSSLTHLPECLESLSYPTRPSFADLIVTRDRTTK